MLLCCCSHQQSGCSLDALRRTVLSRKQLNEVTPELSRCTTHSTFGDWRKLWRLEKEEVDVDDLAHLAIVRRASTAGHLASPGQAHHRENHQSTVGDS